MNPRLTLALCSAFAILMPFMSPLTLADAAHPHVVALVPPSLALAGALAFAAVTIAIAIGEIASGEEPVPVARSGLVFAAAVLLSSFLGFDPRPGIAAAIVFGATALAFSASQRAGAEGGWRVMAAAFAWSGIVFCGAALGAMLLRRPPELYAFAHGRAIGIFENPNELAEFALALCAVGIGCVLAGAQRALGWCALALGTITIAATGSRSGEVAFGIGALVLLAGLRPRRGIAVLVVCVALAGVIGAFGLDSRRNPAENDTRIAAWRAGVRTAALFPLTGVGVGAYERVYPLVRGLDAPGASEPIGYDPHNFYLSVAAETGLLGLWALIAVAATFLGELRSALSCAGPHGETRRFSLAVGAGLAAIACHLVFNAFAVTVPLFALMAALAVGAARSEYRVAR